MKAVLLWIVTLSAVAADVTSTRVSSGDWQTQDANGVKIQDYARQDTAIVGCINTPTCVYIVGGKYKIARAVTNPPPANPPPPTGTAALSWTAPAKNTDGSTISAAITYNVYHGLSAAALTDKVPVNGLAYTYANLASGTHYFAVTAVVGGSESALSAVGSKVIP
jgi:hypothetical protein